VYKHEIPGGQYTNLQFQVVELAYCRDSRTYFSLP
jgi:pyruvate carboxylase